MSLQTAHSHPTDLSTFGFLLSCSACSTGWNRSSGIPEPGIPPSALERTKRGAGRLRATHVGRVTRLPLPNLTKQMSSWPRKVPSESSSKNKNCQLCAMCFRKSLPVLQSPQAPSQWCCASGCASARSLGASPSVAVRHRNRNKTYSFLGTTSSSGCWGFEMAVGTRNAGDSTGAEKSRLVYSSETNTWERRKTQELLPHIPSWVAQVEGLPLLTFVLSSMCSPFCPCQLLLQLPGPFSLPPAMPTLLVVPAVGAATLGQTKCPSDPPSLSSPAADALGGG